MVKTHPDQLVSALSKLLKQENTPTVRFVFKRGGIWQPQYAKAHSRVAKRQLKQEIKAQIGQKQEEEGKTWPLLARLRTNEKEDSTRLRTEVLSHRGTSVVESLMGVFRVNFFKKKGEEDKKAELAGPTKANPQSKASLRKKAKTVRNQERRKKRNQIKREARRAKRVTVNVAK